MGEVVGFPTDRIHRHILQGDSLEVVSENLKALKTEWADQVARELILGLYTNIQSRGIDCSSPVLMKDLSLVWATIVSALRRNYGIPHNLQRLSDNWNQNNPEAAAVVEEFIGLETKETPDDPEPMRFA